MVVVGAVGWVLMGSAWGAAMLAVVIAALLVQLAGLLPHLGVQLNAVSLVNLTMVIPSAALPSPPPPPRGGVHMHRTQRLGEYNPAAT